MKKGESFTMMGKTEARKSNANKLELIWRAFWTFREMTGGLMYQGPYTLPTHPTKQELAIFKRSYMNQTKNITIE
jgi:hypothetical protein